MVRVHARVSGLVQGVGFRAFACRQAAQHGLTGWVKNTADGRVETEAQGPREAVEGYLQDLWRGPRLAQVTNVETTWIDSVENDKGFDVLYD